MLVVDLPASGSAKPVVLADVGPRRILQPVGVHGVLPSARHAAIEPHWIPTWIPETPRLLGTTRDPCSLAAKVQGCSGLRTTSCGIVGRDIVGRRLRHKFPVKTIRMYVTEKS